MIGDDGERLLAAAVRYSALGWPIVPVCPVTDRLVCARPPDGPGTAHEWWSDRPYGIACLTGTVFEAPRPLSCDWSFPVTPGSPTIAELPRLTTGIRHHCAGHWVALPPTRNAVWISRQADLNLPHSLTVQWTVVRAAIASRRTAR